ncbi:zinc finger bed domain-containing protein 4-like protein [Lasius niger]|uniref:Zinc finger bed domain-containing protein 4-like protein n=1 Tax=Lasius niger TaxID=67767 RepID=A0A0J7MSZ0_LASNI|nr:zinc finger bed domain-containing protein 4-like protein [Lasius niger]
MINHIKNKHEDEFRQLKIGSLPKEQTVASSSNQDISSLCQTRKKDLKQMNLLEYKETLKQWDINDIRAKKYHYLIGEMLAVDNESISMVERPGFTRLMKKTLPQYKIPSRLYFTDKIIPDIYNKMVAKIKKMLAETNAISVTTDMWTCMHNSASFLSFTAHWLTCQFELKHAVLNIKHFEGQHTGQNISSALLEIPNFWEIDLSKIHVVVQGGEKLLVQLLPVDSTRRDRQHCIINMVPQN